MDSADKMASPTGIHLDYESSRQVANEAPMKAILFHASAPKIQHPLDVIVRITPRAISHEPPAIVLR